jgi:hypothetical protein
MTVQTLIKYPMALVVSEGTGFPESRAFTAASINASLKGMYQGQKVENLYCQFNKNLGAQRWFMMETALYLYIQML